MNNDDITIDKKMLEGFLKEIARGGIKQDGKVISDVEMLVADKPTSCNNNSFNGLNFSNEQLVKVRAEYKKILEKYEDKLDDVFRNRAAYNKRLDEIEGVFDSLSSTQEEIRNLSARDISNLSSPELKHLKKLYKDLNKYNVDYINRQNEIILYVHAEKRGIETAFSDEIKYRSLINKDTRNSCEKKLIEKYEYKHNAPIFGVSSGNEFLNILQNLQNKIVNLNSGKLTNFTKNMFDKSTGKFTVKQDGIFSKIRNFADKHFTSEKKLKKLDEEVQNLRNDMLVNDIIMNKIKKIYKTECDHISQNEKRLSYNDVVNMVNAMVIGLPEQYSSDICTKVEEKIKVYLTEIEKNIEKNGYTMLEALNAALHSDENSYDKKQNLLSEYKKASTKLFRIESNQFKKENNGIDLSHTTEEDNSYDVRDVPNPIGEKTSADEYEEPVITNENNEKVLNVQDEEQNNEYLDSDLEKTPNFKDLNVQDEEQNNEYLDSDLERTPNFKDLNVQDEEQNNEYLDSDLERTPNFSNHDLNNMSGKDAKIPETEPVTELDIKTELSTETSNTSTNENNQNEPASETDKEDNIKKQIRELDLPEIKLETENKENRDNDFSDNENEEEVHENTEIQNDEPYFVRASNNYITSLEKAKGSLNEKRKEITEHLQERLELDNQQKIKYGDIVPESNEDLYVIALQKEKRNIEKKLKDITKEIEDEKEKLASMKQQHIQHIVSQLRAKERDDKIQYYTKEIANIENGLRERREKNIKNASIWGNVEDTIEDDIANDEELKEYNDHLNELKEKRDVLNSESINAKLEYIAMLEAKIKSNDSLSDEEKQNARRQLLVDFDEYTNSVNEESYKPRTK